jgi:hypothetical protein
LSIVLLEVLLPLTVEKSRGVEFNEMLAPYKKSSLFRSLFQLANTAVPFFLLWALMYKSLQWSYWTTLLLAVPTALFVVRLFSTTAATAPSSSPPGSTTPSGS